MAAFSPFHLSTVSLSQWLLSTDCRDDSTSCLRASSLASMSEITLACSRMLFRRCCCGVAADTRASMRSSAACSSCEAKGLLRCDSSGPDASDDRMLPRDDSPLRWLPPPPPPPLTLRNPLRSSGSLGIAATALRGVSGAETMLLPALTPPPPPLPPRRRDETREWALAWRLPAWLAESESLGAPAAVELRVSAGTAEAVAEAAAAEASSDAGGPPSRTAVEAADALSPPPLEGARMACVSIAVTKLLFDATSSFCSSMRRVIDRSRSELCRFCSSRPLANRVGLTRPPSPDWLKAAHISCCPRISSRRAASPCSDATVAAAGCPTTAAEPSVSGRRGGDEPRLAAAPPRPPVGLARGVGDTAFMSYGARAAGGCCAAEDVQVSLRLLK
eukprot:Rhum_TRINITY_DN14746_c13_g1::Rhum_TRINITY_DN14746_c13_g1_i1::g.115234::m.115234